MDSKNQVANKYIQKKNKPQLHKFKTNNLNGFNTNDE